MIQSRPPPLVATALFLLLAPHLLSALRIDKPPTASPSTNPRQDDLATTTAVPPSRVTLPAHNYPAHPVPDPVEQKWLELDNLDGPFSEEEFRRSVAGSQKIKADEEVLISDTDVVNADVLRRDEGQDEEELVGRGAAGRRAGRGGIGRDVVRQDDEEEVVGRRTKSEVGIVRA